MTYHHHHGILILKLFPSHLVRPTTEVRGCNATDTNKQVATFSKHMPNVNHASRYTRCTKISPIICHLYLIWTWNLFQQNRTLCNTTSDRKTMAWVLLMSQSYIQHYASFVLIHFTYTIKHYCQIPYLIILNNSSLVMPGPSSVKVMHLLSK